MKINKLVSVFLLTIASTFSFSQNKESDYLNKRWNYVATRMPSEWYGSEEAKQVAKNVMLTQKEIGGWAKNKPYHHIFSQLEKTEYLQGKYEKGGTFDNGSTITELEFLAKVYSKIKDDRYKQAFEKGLNYLFISQYKNGGWPQYYPIKDPEDEIALDKTEPYSMHITYNDNAMVNTMRFLKEIYSNNEAFSAFHLSDDLKLKAKNAFDKGIDCFLKTQIIIDNEPTVWCAQHNAETLAPANARSYELASFSGSESVGIVLMLMDIENPSKDIIASINGAVKWFKNHRIEGLRVERITQEDGKRNRIVVEDKNASTLWGRFHDLKTGKIFFCDRDGIKKNTLAEIGYNRRNGYSWYTNAPEIVFEKYEEWQWQRVCYSDVIEYIIRD